MGGWILLPAVLTPAEIEAMKAEVYAGAKQSYEGALQNLLDHPAITGILSEILSEDPFVGEEYYGFRCEGSFTTVRPPGWSKMQRGDQGMPHVVRPSQQANAMRYQVAAQHQRVALGGPDTGDDGRVQLPGRLGGDLHREPGPRGQ